MHPALAIKDWVKGSPNTKWLCATPNTGDSSRTWLAVVGLTLESACDQHQNARAVGTRML